MRHLHGSHFPTSSSHVLCSDPSTAIRHCSSLLALLLLGTRFCFHSEWVNMLNLKQAAKLRNKAKQNRSSFSVLNNASTLILAANFCYFLLRALFCVYIFHSFFRPYLLQASLPTALFAALFLAIKQRNPICQWARIMWYKLHIACFQQLSSLDVFSLLKDGLICLFLVSKIERKIKLLLAHRSPGLRDGWKGGDGKTQGIGF